jgi:predicted CXXCH cytochrome family protein
VKKSRILVFITLLGLVVFAGYVSSQWTSYHNFDGKCLDCHLTVPAPGDPVGTFTMDITRMCVTCHTDVQSLSHPVDVVPTMVVPPTFPLDWKGEVTCVSCHTVHNQGFGGFHVRIDATGEGFCVNCHDNLASELHKISVGTAHAGQTVGANYQPGQFTYVLDELSIRCMACHDAVFASESLSTNPAFATTDGGMFHNIYSIGLSHPIGMNYYDIKIKYQGAYRNVADLPQEIKLFGGVIGCATCHNPYSALHDELVMSNEGSALCLGCHVK